jgi:CheY-like chemotaxis protein
MPPGMDGFELAQEMRRKYPHIKTLLTSGFSKLFFDRGRIDGAEFTVLSRPYMRADLAEAVQAALDQ